MSTKAKREATTDAIEIIHQRYFEGKPAMLALLEEERVNASIARKIHELRDAAGFSRRQLARIIGLPASAIQELEEASFEGNSLVMLNRIAAVLKQRVEIRCVPLKRKLEPV